MPHQDNTNKHLPKVADELAPMEQEKWNTKEIGGRRNYENY